MATGLRVERALEENEREDFRTHFSTESRATLVRYHQHPYRASLMNNLRAGVVTGERRAQSPVTISTHTKEPCLEFG